MARLLLSQTLGSVDTPRAELPSLAASGLSGHLAVEPTETQRLWTGPQQLHVDTRLGHQPASGLALAPPAAQGSLAPERSSRAGSRGPSLGKVLETAECPLAQAAGPRAVAANRPPW